jgi:hypothetical protein
MTRIELIYADMYLKTAVEPPNTPMNAADSGRF